MRTYLKSSWTDMIEGHGLQKRCIREERKKKQETESRRRIIVQQHVEIKRGKRVTS